MEQSKPLELPKEWIKKIKVDGIKYESATQHEGLGPAIYGEGAMAYAPWLYTCQMNYATLQARCDKYEAALKELVRLKELKDEHGRTNEYTELQPLAWKAARKALSSDEGDKVKQWWEGKAIDEMPEYVKITGVGCSIERDVIVKAEGAGVFDDPFFHNEGQLYVLVRDKYFEQHGRLTRMNCKNIIPATKAEYEAHIKGKEGTQ